MNFQALILCGLSAFGGLHSLSATAQAPLPHPMQTCYDQRGKRVFTDQPCEAGQRSDNPDFVPMSKEEQDARARFHYENSRREFELRKQERELREQQRELERQQRAHQQAQQFQEQQQSRKANSYACDRALREMTFAERKGRQAMNTAILKANQACGTNTPLLQDPAQVHVHPRSTWR